MRIHFLLVYTLFVKMLVSGSLVSLASTDCQSSTQSFPEPPKWPHMPYILFEAKPKHAPEVRMFNCSAGGIVVASNGRLWASWDSGGYGEGEENFILLATSGDGGETWSEPKMIIDPPFRASYSMVWIDPNGRMWFVFNTWPIRSAVEDRVGMRELFDDIRSFEHFIQTYNYRIWKAVGARISRPLSLRMTGQLGRGSDAR